MSECRYCASTGKKVAEMRPNDIILFGASYIYWGDGKPYPLTIKYCPHCGRKVKEDKANG